MADERPPTRSRGRPWAERRPGRPKGARSKTSLGKFCDSDTGIGDASIASALLTLIFNSPGLKEHQAYREVIERVAKEHPDSYLAIWQSQSETNPHIMRLYRQYSHLVKSVIATRNTLDPAEMADLTDFNDFSIER